jgi:hypothetical protein
LGDHTCAPPCHVEPRCAGPGLGPWPWPWPDMMCCVMFCSSAQRSHGQSRGTTDNWMGVQGQMGKVAWACHCSRSGAKLLFDPSVTSLKTTPSSKRHNFIFHLCIGYCSWAALCDPRPELLARTRGLGEQGSEALSDSVSVRVGGRSSF